MSLHGLDAYKMTKEAAQETLRDILEDNAEKYQYQPAVQEHKNLLLKKYLYFHDKGEEEKEGQVEDSVLESSQNLGNSSSSAQEMLGDQTRVKVQIKFEKEEQKKLKELMGVAETCKKVLQPQLNVAQDLVHKITYQELHDTMTKGNSDCCEFLDNLRSFCALERKLYEFDDKELKDLCLVGEKYKIQGVAHQEAMKSKIKQARANLV